MSSGRMIDELVIWAMQVQAAHKVVGRAIAGAYPAGYRSSLSRAAEIGRLGCTVDCYGAASQGSDDLHPDAEAVVDQLSLMERDVREIVMAFALSGLRPDWMEGAVTKCEAVTKANGKLLIERFEHEDWQQEWCVIRILNEPVHIEYMRAKYCLWYVAMNELAKHLRDQGVEVQDLGCESAPWAVGGK